MTRLRNQRLPVALLALAAALVFAAPASAGQVTAVPVISGSGTITGPSSCAATDVPNGTITGCPKSVAGSEGPFGVPGIIQLTASPQASPAGHWQFVRWDNCPTSVVNPVCTLIDASTGSSAFAPRAVFEDHVGPSLGTPSVNYSVSSDRTVTVNWASNEPLTAARCTVDAAAETTCGTLASQTLTLSEGSHTVKVRGTDRSGNVGGFSTATFRILDTTLVSGPTNVSNDKNPTFVFSSVAGLTFDCSLDNVTITVGACGNKNAGNNQGSKAFTNLADGTHTFRVVARDNSDFDRVPVVRTWRVDTVAPVATLSDDSGPREGALQAINTETFKFTANEAGSTFECRLDAADFGPCTTGIVLERLTAGAHRFDVRAVDLAGNVGAVASRNWSVAAADNDNDGFNALIDCNDADPAIRPGALEINDNGVDENCDGVLGVTPPPPVIVTPNTKPEQIVVTLAFFASSVNKKTTKLSTLQVKNVPLGATVTAVCSGKGCPSALKGKGFTKKNAFGTVTLAKFIKKAFKAGDRITFAVSKPNAIAAVKVLTVRSAKKPQIATKCIPPGTSKAVSC